MVWRSITTTALLFLLLGTNGSAQRVAADGLIGTRTFSDGTGMVAIELRGDVQFKGWPVRPVIGWAGATDTYGTQNEYTLGARAEGRASTRVIFSGGMGVSWLSQDGGEWNSGRSTGPYFNAAVLYALGGKLRVGLDVRILTGSSFVRADGLVQDVNFSQYGIVVSWRRR
ncbi:MAG: hypothetical protein ABR616_04450 [Dermatophilaceae bacterium]